MLTEADVRRYLDTLTKPPGSLGQLEDVAVQLCLTQQTQQPRTTPRRLVLFAGDHGVVASGVSAWPSDVTSLMVANIAGGGAASSVLAKQTGTELEVIDVGVAGEPCEHAGVRSERVRPGTRNLAVEPAMTAEEYSAALDVGRSAAARAAEAGCRLAAAGEMGIGNTTPASCLVAAITGAAVEDVVGRGAGADDAALAKKYQVVRDALERTRRAEGVSPRSTSETSDVNKRTDVASLAAELGGLEIAAMTGFFLEATSRGLTVLLDGFIATAAALVAHAEVTTITSHIIAAHRSAEPGHTIALDHLGLSPILDGWNLRLGEGTGALTALPHLDAAAAIVNNMATFADLGIST